MATDPQLVLKLSSLAHAGFEDYSVLCEGKVVGRVCIAKSSASGKLWFWVLAYRYHEGRTPTHGYEDSREQAMAAFAKSWRRE
jgi:hypothetical protein